jgi:type I restriction enzyme R subunit
MEHAIRKHCTVHFEEDPAFYAHLSEKLERLMREHHDNWEALAQQYEQLRLDALAGRTEGVAGLSREASTFYDHIVLLAYGGRPVPSQCERVVKDLMTKVVETLQSTIGIIDFWRKPNEVKRLRGTIDTEILLTALPELTAVHERLAVEITKLAEKRHWELTR